VFQPDAVFKERGLSFGGCNVNILRRFFLTRRFPELTISDEKNVLYVKSRGRGNQKHLNWSRKSVLTTYEVCLFVLIILLSSIQRMAVPASPTCYVVVICIGAANLEPSDKYLPVVASIEVASRKHSCRHSKSHYTISNIQVKLSIVNPKVRHFAELLVGFSNLRTLYHKRPW